MHRIIIIFMLLLAGVPCGLIAQEVRGVWLTTNAGLDWPDKNATVEERKKKLVDMLDRLEKAHFNLVLFQVQANGDVAWDSKIQPAMEQFTGNGVRRLDYDVCRFVIDECHKRGMKCHAWVVPYRLGTEAAASKYRNNHVGHAIYRHRDMCVKYRGAYYLDPGLPSVRKYLVKLYKELLEKYDFDGINLDYTRYPGDDFPDGASFRRHNSHKLDKNDWRRDNINRFVAELYKAVKKIDRNIAVGSAPIGTYKNVKGYKNTTAYGSFQQDPGEWIASRHHDLVIPQMYWGEDFGFSTHLSTWVDVADGQSLIVGLAPYKMVEGKWTASDVIQLMNKAVKAKGVDGVCFFRAAHILGNDRRVKELYNYLVDNPPSPAVKKVSRKEKPIESVEKFLE